MNRFSEACAAVKEAVPIRDAAARYGLIVNRSGFASCPLHLDKTPSMRVNGNSYYCFSCHAKGSVIDLTCMLLDINAHQAVARLASDFIVPMPSMLPPTRAETRAYRVRRIRAAMSKENASACERIYDKIEGALYMLYLDCYHEMTDNRPSSGEWNDAFSSACRLMPQIRDAIAQVQTERRMET